MARNKRGASGSNADVPREPSQLGEEVVEQSPRPDRLEFEGRNNDRPYDTIDQMEMTVRGMEGKRLRYSDLKAAAGPSGARPMAEP